MGGVTGKQKLPQVHEVISLPRKRAGVGTKNILSTEIYKQYDGEAEITPSIHEVISLPRKRAGVREVANRVPADRISKVYCK